jgi:hypothetical protein
VTGASSRRPWSRGCDKSVTHGAERLEVPAFCLSPSSGQWTGADRLGGTACPRLRAWLPRGGSETTRCGDTTCSRRLARSKGRRRVWHRPRARRRCARLDRTRLMADRLGQQQPPGDDRMASHRPSPRAASQPSRCLGAQRRKRRRRPGRTGATSSAAQCPPGRWSRSAGRPSAAPMKRTGERWHRLERRARPELLSRTLLPEPARER